jgi:hypothetical protein
VCQACPANSIAPQGSDGQTDCKCNAGYTGSDGGTCTACVAGKYKIGTGSGTCADCEAGKYSTTVGATSDMCQACPANSIAPAASNELMDCI